MRFLIRIASACLLLVLATTLSAQSIFTVAGGGSDDGRLATEIALNGPRGIALDGGRYLYIAERFQGVVRRVDLSTNRVETVAGIGAAGYGGDNGPAKRATLNEPRGLFVAENGDLYIADSTNGRVRRIDAATGIIRTVAGGGNRPDQTNGDGGPATEAVLRTPWGIWIDRGNLYITEAGFEGQKIRKVVLSTGIISTIAGPANGEEGFAGDGGPALQAKFRSPLGIIADSAGNLFIADADNGRIRRIDAATGNIETYAGGGEPASGIGDDGPATAAKLNYPTTMSFDPGGNLLIATDDGVRRVDKTARMIKTIVPSTGRSYGIVADPAGNIFISSELYAVLRAPAGSTEFTYFAGQGTYIGDSLVATSAVLRGPLGIAVDAAGNLFIADSSNLVVRRVDAVTQIITTFAGNQFFYDNDQGNGEAATSVAMYPMDVAIGPDGNLYIADLGNGRIKKVDIRTGILTFFAGGGDPPNGNNEGLPPLQARLPSPYGIAFDSRGNLYIAGGGAHRVWRIDPAGTAITAFAGTGSEGYAGDGGPATAATLDEPLDVAADAAGNVYITDLDNGVVRRVGTDGIISSYTRQGNPSPPFGDGGPASEAYLAPTRLAYDATTDALLVADEYSSRVRRIDLKSSIVTTVAGNGTAYFVDRDFQGDNGRATEAKMNFGFSGGGLAVSPQGDLYISDTSNNRIRAVYACRVAGTPSPSTPADAASEQTTAPTLTWSAGARAFRYDVFLDTVPDPLRLVASDIDETAYTPSNLTANTKYYWKVRAKGDPFCDPISTATSAVRSFTTTGRCGVGSFDLLAPTQGATNVNPIVLSWQGAAGAGSYDVYFGNVNPPPLYRSSVTQTSLPVTGGTGTHYWTVVAHAACDASKTASAPVRSFTPLAPGVCTGSASVTLLAPANLATGVTNSVDLSWRADGCAASPFAVYFGTQPDPPLLVADTAAASQRVDALTPSTTYYWKVIGTNVNGGRVASPVASFTTRACAAPGQPAISFSPASAAAGGTYVIVWTAAAGLDADGGYLVERSTSPTFANVESQITTSTAATFIAGSAGTWYHRVRAIPSCDPTRTGPASAVVQVVISAPRPNVIFTVQPAAVVRALGEKLEDIRGRFTLENIGGNPVRVACGRQELNGSPPFFTIVDPQGSDLFVTLQPRAPRTFEIRYSGPRNDVPGSYQGVIYVAGEGLSVIPYAFVDLRVGESGGSSPQFLVDGVPSEYVAFPGRSGDDNGRPPVTVSIRNNGSEPMELAAEVGPEVWLLPERGWNAGRIEPNSSRSINLTTRRTFAPNGSALPRYTYFTVRTRDGGSARLLVQDNDQAQAALGRNVALGSGERSFIIPEVVSTLTTAGSLSATRLRLTNAGTDSVQVELIGTPQATDGFDPLITRRAVVVVPPNDVVTLTDPLTQVLGLTRPAFGQIEVRVPPERLGLISVSASTVAIDGNTSITIPTVNRGEGARLNLPHTLFGVTETPSTTTSLVLAETSGLDTARVRATLFNAAGARLGESTFELRRYGYFRVDLVTHFGGSNVEYGRVELNVESGSGSVIGMAIVRDRSSESGATFVSRPAAEHSASSRILAAFARTKSQTLDTLPSVTTVVPVLTPPTSAGVAPTYRTVISLAATTTSPARFKAVLKGINGAELASTPTIDVSLATSVVLKDAVKDLFGTAAAPGSIFVEATGGGKVYALLQAASTPSSSPYPSTALPLSTTVSEVLSSASGSMQRSLFVDGLEQSVDSTRGNRWMLLLNEVSGASGTVRITLYEAGNRSSPIGEKDVPINAYQQVTLDTVFAAVGLDAPDRRKDRTNVQVAVTAVGGSARVAASAVSVDNRTGDTKVLALRPSVGSASAGTTLVTAVPPPAPPTSRRRAARP